MPIAKYRLPGTYTGKVRQAIADAQAAAPPPPTTAGEWLRGLYSDRYNHAYHKRSADGRPCGGDVDPTDWWRYPNLACNNCAAKWTQTDLQQLEERGEIDKVFHLRSHGDAATVLVWKTDEEGRVRYTARVPAWQADFFEPMIASL